MATDNPYRSLPSVDRLLSDDRVRCLALAGYGAAVNGLAKQSLEAARSSIARGAAPPTDEQLVESVLGLAQALLQPSLKRVINATGVIIHTNLGRAPLSDDAVAAMVAVSRGYSNLEFELPSGHRGSRFSHLERLLTQVCGGESAIAVNNNASALLLTLSALCRDREVIISRGQLVEIGGGFRIPDVLRQSGARLVEVGTTNRTYSRDYESAITSDSAALLRVHTSNFRVIGFTESAALEDLADIAHSRGLAVLDDIGSGCLLDTTRYGLIPEPTVGESLAAGADLVLFSGDKLLGGPQAGIIVGRSDLIAELRRHPLARAVRMDKASIAALAATLMHYLKGEALTKVPVWRMISASVEEMGRRSRRWARELGAGATVMDGRSMIGGGSLPEESLPTRLLAIQGDGRWLTEVSRQLRTGDPPVVGRIEGERLLLDPRTVAPEDDRALVRALRAATPVR